MIPMVSPYLRLQLRPDNFMHMGSENRTFVTWVAIVTLLVFAALQYSWTDSYRMERDAPQSFKGGPPQ